MANYSQAKQAYLSKVRAERLEKLVGKFVIVCESPDPNKKGQQLYLQDRKLAAAAGKNGRLNWWTQFTPNAWGFATYQEASLYLSKLKYNNPHIVRM